MKNQKLWSWITSSLLICLAACSTGPGDGGYKIAIVPARDGQHGIFVMNADGTGGKLLTSDAGAELRPSSWSPDGKKIAFFSYGSEDSALSQKYKIPLHSSVFVIDAGGGSSKQLLDVPVSSFGWSPDSRKMFFISAYEDPETTKSEVMSGKKAPSSAIYILDLKTTSQDRITSLAQYSSAAWSPDGARLAFSSGTDLETNIYAASLDGKSIRRVAESPPLNIRPSWSPDGKSIAYIAIPSASTAEQATGVYIANAEGGNRKRITDMSCTEATWSPDGKLLLLQSANGIYLIGPQGGKPAKLSVGTDRPLDAAFTPDGDKILFRSNHEGPWHLYGVGLSGGEPKRITGQLSASSFCLSPGRPKK